MPDTRLPLKRRIGVLIAAIAVPAMAAPGDFGAVAADAPLEPIATTVALTPDDAMPFETPGSSFPGSAFYFLADPPEQALVALPNADPLDRGSNGRELGELIDVGPAASPFFSAGTGTSHSRAQKCLAQAIYYEAASESEAGQRAVAQVVLNRVAHPGWPASICGVVYQGSQRSTGCQFSFTCDGSMARKPGRASWAKAERIAARALSGDVYAPIGHATHYHTLWVNPYWAKTLDHVGTIGAHRFYRSRGAAGRKSAFTQSYSGVEPGVSGRTVRPAPETAETGGAPAASQVLPVPVGGETTATFTAGPGTAPTIEAAQTLPSPRDPAVSGSGQVREDYAKAGQWKDDAAAKLAERERGE